MTTLEEYKLENEKRELKFLLRQVMYARCNLGTMFCDELKKWHLEDIEKRIYRALGDL